jgi:hypothetical protein
MGLFGGGNSKNTTINEDNRTVYDQSGSTFDNSVDNSVHSSYSSSDDNSFNYQSSDDNSITSSYSSSDDNSFNYQSSDDNSTANDGQFAGVVGNVNYTTIDGGAFNVASQANAGMSALARDALELSLALNQDSSDTARESLNVGVKLSDNAQQFALASIEHNSDLVNSSYDLADSLYTHTLNNSAENVARVTDAIVNSNNNNLDLALSTVNAATTAQAVNNDFAYSLARQSGELALAQTDTTTDALNNGFKSMMQFAESFSRSDGAAIVEQSSKTMLYLVGAVIAGALIYKKI